METSLLTFATAFVGGFLAFFSPCVLPLFPVWFLYISGASSKEALTRNRPKTLILSLGFVFGVALIFSALGASASAIGLLLLSYHGIVEKLAGAIVIVLGLNVMGVFNLEFLHRHREVRIGASTGGFAGAVLMGLSFGLSWTPCVGLELGAFYLLASREATVWQGAGLLFAFASGLGLPFVVAGLLIERFSSFYKRISRHLRKIQVISGLMICLLGVLVFTGRMETISIWLIQLF